jgi:UDP-N-acetylmuramoylalanine-D-glutamate ligase
MWLYLNCFNNFNDYDRSLLRPALFNTVLAPTEDQHLKYYTWLHIYSKDKANILEHMVKLVNNYNVCSYQLFFYLMGLMNHSP